MSSDKDIGLLRASFGRVMAVLIALAAIVDSVFFEELPRSALGTLVVTQAGVFAPLIPLGLHYLSLVRDPSGRLHRRWVLPNVLTLSRILAIPPIVIGLQHLETPRIRIGVMAIFFVAVVSDMLDGIIARRFARQSDLGRVLDPFADTVFYSSVTAALFAVGQLPTWFLAVAFVRFIPSFVAGFTLFLRRGPIEIAPTLLGKASSFSMGVATLAFTAQATLNLRLAETWITVLTIAVAGLCVLSALEYGLLGLRRLQPEKPR